jgi:Regulator of chromosome condensation (RCC1) repeat
VASGYNHACAILEDGTLWCWGQNCKGQLGIDDPLAGPTDVSDCVSGLATTLGVPTPTQIGAATEWFAVAGGQGHTCGLRGTGQLWCWGRNVRGTLGLGGGEPIQVRVPRLADWTKLELGQASSYGLRASGSFHRWGDDHGVINMSPTQLGTDSDWTKISLAWGIRRTAQYLRRLLCDARAAHSARRRCMSSHASP